MDPNATLESVRRLFAEMESGALSPEQYSENAVEAVSLFSSLDEWLSRGGYKPEDWAA